MRHGSTTDQCMIKYEAKLERGGFEHAFFLAWEQSQSNFLLNNLFPLVVLREVSQFMANKETFLL